ncbi:MAG TPA: response regulator [Thermoanaerobaculia bacterium]
MMVTKRRSTAEETTVLLVDDELTFVATLGRILQEAGFRTTSATSLRAAREFLSEHHVDAVVTDLVLGTGPASETGVDLVRELQQNKPSIPVIVLSAFAGDFADELRALGVRVIAKSALSLDGLVEVIDGAIENRAIPIQAVEVVNLDDVRRVVKEELASLSELKESTLMIPGEGRYELPKPLIGFKKDLERQMLRYPFERNVFLMMKFRPATLEIAAYMRETLQRRGFLAVRADDVQWNITRSVYNPIAVLYCCKYGIALFDEPEADHAYSPNVAYELGIMHQQNKECLILKHASLPSPPFDLIKDLHVPYERDLQLGPLLVRWLESIPALE